MSFAFVEKKYHLLIYSIGSFRVYREIDLAAITFSSRQARTDNKLLIIKYFFNNLFNTKLN